MMTSSLAKAGEISFTATVATIDWKAATEMTTYMAMPAMTSFLEDADSTNCVVVAALMSSLCL